MTRMRAPLTRRCPRPEFPVYCGAKDTFKDGRIERNRVAASRRIDRRLATNDIGLAGADADLGERVRNAQFAPKFQDPTEKSLRSRETGRSSTRAMTSALSAIADRLKAMTYGRMTALVSPWWVLNHEPTG